MSARALNWAWQQNPPTASQKLVLAALADRADDEGICYPSIRWVAVKCKPMTERTVRWCLTELCKTGMVEKVARLRRTDGTLGAWTYRLRLNASSDNGWPVDPVTMGCRTGTVEQVLPLETYVSSANEPDSSQKDGALRGEEEPHDTAQGDGKPFSPPPNALAEGPESRDSLASNPRSSHETSHDPGAETPMDALRPSASAPVPADQAAPAGPLPPSSREGPPVSLEDLWDACEAHVQKAPTAKSHRKAYAKLVRELLEAGWTPEQVASRARAYRKNAMTRDWPLTLAALAKWGEHVERKKPSSSRLLSEQERQRLIEDWQRPILPQPENARRMRELLEGMS